MSKDKQKWEVCKKCNQEIKPVRVAPGKAMALMCDCGIFDKSMNKIHDWNK